MTATNLPTIVPQPIGATTVQTADARELYAFLCVKLDFSTWIKDRIVKYDFVEGVDFVSYEGFCSPDLGSKNDNRGGHNPIAYALTIHMAKELSTVENNAKGREARRYFIAKEEARDKVLTPIEQAEANLAGWKASETGWRGRLRRLFL